MEFNEFRQDIYDKWQNKLMKFCIAGTGVVLFAQIIIFYLFKMNDAIERSISSYLTIRILIPSGINIFFTILFYIWLHSNRFTMAQKNRFVIMNVFVICSIIAIFHNYFKFLLVTIGLPIVCCTIFADRKSLRTIFILSNFTFILAVLFMVFDDYKTPMIDLLTTVICAYTFIVFIYEISSAVVNSQARQIDFIYSSNQKEVELIQELKIEPLTKLYNKTAMNSAVNTFVRKFHDGQIEPHLVLFDIDHFKQINDTYGHANGDKVLVRLALIIKNAMGGIRLSFRFGGEEFVLLFETENEYRVLEVVEQIRRDFTNTQFDFVPDKKFTLSAGIAKLQNNWDSSIWFNAADSAMYKAKNTGRDKVVIYTD